MKAISLWNPWAALIRCGAKTIETRSWSTQYRGQLAIHAAKKRLRRGAHHCRCAPRPERRQRQDGRPERTLSVRVWQEVQEVLHVQRNSEIDRGR